MTSQASQEQTVANPKEAAGREAAELVEGGMRVGLGTGSTVAFTLAGLGERIAKEGLVMSGVPTSIDTRQRALELGIPLVTLEEVERLDLTIDGADEIDGQFQMIKGGGGALLREKVVASISERVAIVVGRDKVVERLGVSFLLPVEVAPFALPTVARELRGMGCDPVLRLDGPSEPFLTDNANHIFDCRFPGGITDAKALERELASVPGIVESGLFIGLAHTALIGAEDGSVTVTHRGD
ncbi:MAG: ribose-5-phosphate isomerase RpiA [Planctomycetota bacterium]|nr:ribose-5-phosphate isomerase RpiA [Planctomycetota bacterium]MDP6762666.1 ribose-5-phosphate isomerase RpiA [Planctomycetota bacterium]MDP6989975.1 ribose-5-phosphate isomerase RpiA [Planctomycetota bacterium]